MSTHTLTAAAYNFLRDVTNRSGEARMVIKDGLFEYVTPGQERAVREQINSAENLFKHAGKNDSAILVFDPGQMEFLTLDPVWQYHILTEESDSLLETYRLWFVASYPVLFNLPDSFDASARTAATKLVSNGSHTFFTLVLPLLMKL